MKEVLLVLVLMPFVLGTPSNDKVAANNKLIDNNVKVVIEGVRSEKGKIVLAVFKDQQGFKMKKPIKRIVLKKSDLEANVFKFHLDPGTYGISVLDDENVNDKMDYNFIGIPKEGFGFSNYYHTGFSKPHFDTFSFKIEKEKVALINIRLRYM